MIEIGCVALVRCESTSWTEPGPSPSDWMMVHGFIIVVISSLVVMLCSLAVVGKDRSNSGFGSGYNSWSIQVSTLII
jgi:hypothetical protein